MFNFFTNLWRTCQNQWHTLFEPEASLSKNERSNLSFELTQRLDDLVRELPDSPVYQQAIHSALEEAFEQWLENPLTCLNHLVVLSNPIQPIASILENSQDILQTKKQITINSLQWDSLPAEPNKIYAKLKTQLERDSKYQEIILIPRLNCFFLRCVNGLEGIEYIRNIVLSDRYRFWVIGSHDWAWHYLDRGCQIDSYFNQSILLPKLDHGQLQEWFAPIITKAKISFDSQPKKLEKKLQQNSQEAYFEKLALVADGCGSLALQLFLHSLECAADNPVAKEERIIAVADNLELPGLPDLSFEEQYVLFFLLLHGNLNVQHLSLALEQTNSIVQSQILTLQSYNLLEQEGEFIRLNPIYYRQIKNLLTKNNFSLTIDADKKLKKNLFR